MMVNIISKDKEMRKDSRLVVVVAIVVVALVLLVRKYQDKGVYENTNSWAVAQERYLSK